MTRPLSATGVAMTIRHFTASAVVFDDQDRVLLVQHNTLGRWPCPGGHVEPDENPVEAAVREEAGETGVRAIIISEPAFAHTAVRSHIAPSAVIEMDVFDSTLGAHRHIDTSPAIRVHPGQESTPAIRSPEFPEGGEAADPPKPGGPRARTRTRADGPRTGGTRGPAGRLPSGAGWSP